MSATQTTGRAGRLSDLLPDAEIEVLLVSDLVNVRYLTGYTGTNGLALVGADTRAFITDFRYVEQAAEQVDASFSRLQAAQDLIDGIEEALPGGELSLGFESTHVSVRQHEKLRAALTDRVTLVPVEGLVEQLRAVKDAREIASVREAARVADAALKEVLAQGLVGRTEREVALALFNAMHRLGASAPSFDAIIAAGPHGALPHAMPRDVQIGPGELVVIDWGAVVDGYCSDCTRTVATGDPGEHAREVYQLVLEAQLAGLAAIRAGAGGREVDATAREVIEAAGYGEQFGHGLGHGVGLEIHEGPRLSRHSDSVLAAGNVVTDEPGIYLAGEFGVRIEDLVVVTDDGCEILTSLPKELTIVA